MRNSMGDFVTEELTHTKPVPAAARAFSREFEVLSLCARSVVDSETSQEIRTRIETGIDWEFLIGSAHQHRVLPLVYRTLATGFANLVPKADMDQFRRSYSKNAKRNLFLTAELLRVVDLFQANNISIIPYKGPVLAASVYGEVSLRQFTDLDVIVQRSAAERAKDLLVSQGYKIKSDIGSEGFAAYMQHEKDLILSRDDSVSLELHWAINSQQSPIHVRETMLWENLRTYPIGGRQVRIHEAEDLLLILCIHGAKHQWEHLGWLCDIAEIIRSHKELSWSGLIERATTLQGKRILFLGLTLARTLLGAEVPGKVVNEIHADPVVNELAERVKGWLIGEKVAVGERERYYMTLRERPADKARVALNQMKHYLKPTTRDREAFSLRGPLSNVVYVVRPFRLMWQYGLAPFWQFFRGTFER